MDYRNDNHRTKKKGAKKGSKTKQSYEFFDGDAFLKQLQKEKASGIVADTSMPTPKSRK